MKGLLVKDYLVAKDTLRISLISVLIFSAIGIVTKNMMFISMIVMLLGINQTITIMAYEEMSGWRTYSLSLPISRKDIVYSKYVFSVVNTLVVSLLSFGIIILGIYKRSAMSLDELLVSHYSFVAMMLLALMFLIPVIFKYGVEKARIAIMLFFVSIAGVFGGAMYFIARPSEAVLEVIVKKAVLLSPFLLAILLFISIRLSLSIMSKKDF